MIRRALLVAALAALATACGDDSPPTVTIGFRQPAALAVFRGVTLDDTANVRPYIAVANAGRNDLTILDATDDTSVAAPVQLKALVLPVAERPMLLAAASLGDGADKADLLVAVSAGDSVLQVVTTWDATNTVFTEPGEGSPAVDLVDDVIALVALPSAPGTARVAAALAGGKIAVASWTRAADGLAIALGGAPSVVTLPFQPVALAAAPDDPLQADVQTAIYAATLDPIGPGVFGVAEISPDLSSVTALGARGPTRLVAAARLRERGAPSTAKDRTAFDFAAGPMVRVYAVLDESGCGVDKPIDCGVVTLAPELSSAADAIPDDWAGRMPYRAPIPIPGRPLALAVAQPPVVPPSPELTQYAGDAMRVFGGASELATTGVGIVASDDGKSYFLDLGRFKVITAATTLGTIGATVATPSPMDTAADATQLRRRLWVQDPGAGTFVPDLATGNPDLATAATLVKRTPGWTRTTSWTISYQKELPDLAGRSAEAGNDAAGSPWLAMQVGYGTAPRRLTQVVKLWHPALGVREGDIAVIKAAGVPGCVGTPPPGTAAGTAEENIRREFELPIASLLPPTVEYPGGAVSLSAPVAESPETLAAWTACYEGLRSAGAILPRLSATLRAGGFVVTGAAVGYAGRPQEVAPSSWSYALAYPAASEGDEDDLVAACPLADWDGIAVVPVTTCAAACRATCERAVLARKARRVHHNFESCATPDGPADCLTLFAGVTLPAGDVVDDLGVSRPGPVVSFRFGVQEVDAGAGVDPVRGLTLVVSTAGGETPLSPALTAGSPYLASSAVAFDRSTVAASAGYRFLVSYTGDMVLDTTPQLNPPDAVVIR